VRALRPEASPLQGPLRNPYLAPDKAALRIYAILQIWRREKCIWEFDVFGLPLRLALGAHANRAERIIQLRVARTVAIGAAEVLWLARVFMGKAGLMCDASASAAQRTEGGSCNVSGRGWRYCPPAK
jgi:hypothetical protein